MRISSFAIIVLATGLVGCGRGPGHTITNSVGMKLTYIPPGSFTIGSPASEPGRIANETHRSVTVDKGFRIGVTEVTQKQWYAVMGTSPSFFKGDDLPVERVSWHDAVAFCRQLSEMERKRYRLPTDIEWEYACRAGTTTMYHTGQGEAALDSAGWYRRNSNNRSHRVGRKQPNRWGLFDMHGNVWEWCARRNDGEAPGATTGQLDREEDTLRDIRSGSWGLNASDCRSASRLRNSATYRYFDLGLRVVLDLE